MVDHQLHHPGTLGLCMLPAPQFEALCQAGKHLSCLVQHITVPHFWYVKLLDNGFSSDV